MTAAPAVAAAAMAERLGFFWRRQDAKCHRRDEREDAEGYFTVHQTVLPCNEKRRTKKRTQPEHSR
jgi:hypothetical protein